MSREVTQEKPQPIVSMDDLLSIFERGARPRAQYKIGLETEKLGATAEGKALPFEGPRGIETILKSYAQRYDWESVLDQGRVIALAKGSKAITLEPGGQLELSGEAVRTVDALDRELTRHFEELREVSEPLGIRWFSAGVHPWLNLDSAPWMPKSRYAIMRKLYESRPGMGTQMMKLTASSQFNMDYSNEADARAKIRVGSLLGPVVAAMAANAYVEGGKLNGFCSRRQEIWKFTEPDRSGIQPFFIDGTFTFERYRDWAVRLPMYFTVREGNYIERPGLTFEQYMNSFRGEATQADWTLHLTTLFPDVRLKDHLEFRTADATPKPLTLALAAFWIGAVYDPCALDAIDQLLGFPSTEGHRAATDEVAKRGLAASYDGKPMLDLARGVVRIAQEGLSRIDAEQGSNQVGYLDPLLRLLHEGRSLAEQGIAAWSDTYEPSL